MQVRPTRQMAGVFVAVNCIGGLDKIFDLVESISCGSHHNSLTTV